MCVYIYIYIYDTVIKYNKYISVCGPNHALSEY